jgi:hypothetical protein
MDTFQRLEALLASPDPADLPHRGVRICYPGDPKRQQTRLLPLLTRWAQRRYVERGPEPYIGAARTESEMRYRRMQFRRREA